MRAKVKSLLTDDVIEVHSTTDSPDSNLKIHENTELTKIIAQLEAKNIDYISILKKNLRVV